MAEEQVTADQAVEENTEDVLPAESEGGEKLVPVSEAIRYRKRAQAAEQEAGQMREQLTALQSQLDEASKTIDSLERRQRIDALLAESEAIDLDAARLLTERAVMEMDEPDVAEAVEDLRRHKPYLFRKRRGATASAMSARVSDEGDDAAQAAEQAIASGDRKDLLRYLRLRRKT